MHSPPIQAVTLCLWDCLCPSLSLLHVEASSLLCWTHSLSLSLTSETTLLRQFASEVSLIHMGVGGRAREGRGRGRGRRREEEVGRGRERETTQSPVMSA